MTVMSANGLAARCAADGREEMVDLSLTGPLEPGTHVLVFLGAAREVIDGGRAEEIARAVRGLRAVMAGNGPGDAFADLESREPQLPPHLAALLPARATE